MQCPICEAENSASDALCGSCGANLLPAKPEKQTTNLPVGAKLAGGNFSVGRVLGKGGFGITYLGSDLNLRRSVAIKELFPTGCGRDGNLLVPGGNWPEQKLKIAAEKFLNEARTLARFQHPNIVHVYVSFEENNTAYMVMEYLKGRTIHQLIREFTRLPEPESVDYIVQLADALREIHKSNFLHRDIKPSNILVADDGRITLIDFGTSREFAEESIKQMTTMLTPGYAPLEQYTRNAKLGPFTDIYATAATLYHMLTGQIPIAATDQANGAILVPPRQLNPLVSETVSEAVMWSMQLEASQRPQSIDEFIAALEGKITGPTERRRPSRTIADVKDPNPFKARIEAILDELALGTVAPPSSKFDGRIEEITKKLSAISHTQLQAFPICPACFRKTIKEVKGDAATTNCPICRKAPLEISPIDMKHCPVCRKGKLAKYELEANTMFCPVCREAPFDIQRRKKFGFATDDWWVCPSCSTEMNLVIGGKAKLVSFTSDPFGIGKRYRNEILPLPQWHQIAARTNEFYACDNCSAQMDIHPDDHGYTLAVYGDDPYGVGAKHVRQAHPAMFWSNLARGGKADAGNAKCPSCHSEFLLGKEDIKPVAVNAAEYPWSQKLLNRPIPLINWYLSDAGKRSIAPGCICTNCKTEFDTVDKFLKLIFTPKGPLAGREGQAHTREGWHRIAVNLPTRTEEATLRDDLTKLHIAKQEENEHYFKEEAKYQSGLRDELDKLIHKAFTSGFVPILLKDARVFLLDGETLYWESPAKRHMRANLSGDRTWTFEARGVLLLTSQRIMFDNSAGQTWQHALEEVERVEIEDTYTNSVVAVYIRGFAVPLGFEIPHSEFTVTTEYSNHTLRGNSRDFVLVARSIRARQLGEESPSEG